MADPMLIFWPPGATELLIKSLAPFLVAGAGLALAHRQSRYQLRSTLYSLARDIRRLSRFR